MTWRLRVNINLAEKWWCKYTTRSLIVAAFLRSASFPSQFLSFQEELLVCQASSDWSPLCRCRGTYKGGKERPALTHVHKPTCIWRPFQQHQRLAQLCAPRFYSALAHSALHSAIVKQCSYYYRASDLIFVTFSPQMYFLGSIFLHMKARKMWQILPNFMSSVSKLVPRCPHTQGASGAS